jgi:hypothetical protein
MCLTYDDTMTKIYRKKNSKKNKVIVWKIMAMKRQTNTFQSIYFPTKEYYDVNSYIEANNPKHPLVLFSWFNNNDIPITYALTSEIVHCFPTRDMARKHLNWIKTATTADVVVKCEAEMKDFVAAGSLYSLYIVSNQSGGEYEIKPYKCYNIGFTKVKIIGRSR